MYLKAFLTIIILTFTLQSWTKADDIRDFQIDGISIGDSLLDHYSETEIKTQLSKPSQNIKVKE